MRRRTNCCAAAGPRGVARRRSPIASIRIPAPEAAHRGTKKKKCLPQKRKESKLASGQWTPAKHPAKFTSFPIDLTAGEGRRFKARYFFPLVVAQPGIFHV